MNTQGTPTPIQELNQRRRYPVIFSTQQSWAQLCQFQIPLFKVLPRLKDQRHQPGCVWGKISGKLNLYSLLKRPISLSFRRWLIVGGRQVIPGSVYRLAVQSLKRRTPGEVFPLTIKAFITHNDQQVAAGKVHLQPGELSYLLLKVINFYYFSRGANYPLKQQTPMFMASCPKNYEKRLIFNGYTRNYMENED